MTPPPAHPENIVIVLLAIATGVALLSRLVRIPYTVALVVAGLALGALHVVTAPHLTKELVFAVFLPGLVFEAAFQLRFADIRRDAIPIVALAIPGVGVALALTAAVLVAASPVLGLDAFGWRQALVFGSLIAATDPIAVVALFRSLGAPRRLATLIEAESLVNDGTAIVFFGLILTATAGGAISAPGLALAFVRTVGIGAAIGGGLAFVLSQLTRKLDDPMVEITLTAIAGYGAFALAEQLGGSGVIATVVAGLVCGNYGTKIAMSAATREAARSFWEFVAFLLNSVVFLLIGFEISLGELARAWPLIALAAVAVLVARIFVVSVVTASVAGARHPIPRAWIIPLTWGGLRGALSMVLAISLPEDYRGRASIVTMTFGVVILSIVVQGVTMSPVLRRLKMVPDTPAIPLKRPSPQNPVSG